VIRLLHVADVHLGARFAGLGPRGAEQREQLRRTFARCVDVALERGCHLVLVAGDLFDSPYPPRPLAAYAAEQLRRLVQAGVRVFVVAGNHDGAPDGVWRREDFLRLVEGLVVFGDTPQAVSWEEAGVVVVGSSPTPGRSPLEGWHVPAGGLRVGLAHGSVYRPGQVEEAWAIRPEQVRALGLDYLALGDWHSAQEVHPPPHAAWYAGAPEFLGLDQPGFGHVLVVEVSGPGQVQVEPVRVAKRRLVVETLDAGALDEGALRTYLEQAADPDVVLDLTLAGVREPDRPWPLGALVREYADRFFRLHVRDRSHPRLDEDALERFEPSTVLGQFVRRMRERLATCSAEEREELEEALQLGVAALQGREVLA
jgi:DNA repair exonuclease SbcCD nuclease subunit